MKRQASPLAGFDPLGDIETILRIADGIGVNLEDILKKARSAANAKKK
jgi:hypothetical protein